MKLSSRILEERLIEKKIFLQFVGCGEQLVEGCCYPSFPMEESCVETLQHKLLLFDAANQSVYEELCKSDLLPDGFVCVCCGEDRELCFRLPLEVAAILDEYADWKEQIYEKMLEGENLQSIIDCMSSKVCNPFSLMDQNSFILGRSPGYESIPVGTIWDTLKGNYLNLYDFYSPEEWKKLRRLIAEAGREPVLFHPVHDSLHTYYTITLFDQGELIGSIGAMDNNGPFTEGQLAVMEMIRDLLEIYFRTRYDASRSGKVITESFDRLINGYYEPDRISTSLNKRHWQEKDAYRLLTFDFPDVVATEIELTSIVNLIRMRYPKSMLGIRNKQIVVILREKDMGMGEESVLTSLQQFLKQYGLYCGISYAFSGFSDSRYYCEESAFAAACAVKREQQSEQKHAEQKNVMHYVLYESVHLQHLLDTAGKTAELQWFCHPVVRRLQESEKHSDRVLVQCLGAYLLNGRNISRTVKELQIHRNTLIYRLQRLEEILGLSLEKLTREQTLGLILSCEIACGHETV